MSLRWLSVLRSAPSTTWWYSLGDSAVLQHSRQLIHRSYVETVKRRWYSSSNSSNDDGSSYRIANLGDTTKYLLDEGVPNLLQHNLGDSILNENLRLRILPLSFPYIPEISGRASVQSSLSALRLILHTFVLDKKSHLHVLSAKNITDDTERGYSQLGYTVTPKENEKLLVKWRSCSDTTDRGDVSTDGNSGENTTRSGRVDSFDGKCATAATPVIDYILTPSGGRWETVTSLGDQLKVLLNGGTRPKDSDTSRRVLSGTFIFELNEDNTNLVAFTIEDVELTTYGSEVKETGNLFVCE